MAKRLNNQAHGAHSMIELRQLELELCIPQQLPLPLVELITPHPTEWRNWMYLILDRTKKRWRHDHETGYREHVEERVRWFSQFTYEPGVCKRCRTSLWCYEGLPHYCSDCKSIDSVYSLSELAPFA
jgi:hypothetical protein